MDPGQSLFAGSGDNIQLNTNVQHPEEEEDLEDQRRRNQELGNLLTNAFDDLSDDEGDEDDSINSSRLSGNEGSTHIQPSGYYSYNETPLTHLHPYENGSDSHSNARNIIYQVDHALDTDEQNGRHLPHKGLQNGFPPIGDDENNGLYHHPAYHFDGGSRNGEGFGLTDDHHYRQADLGSQEQLMVMYGARVREVKRLTDALDSFRQEKDSEIELLKRQLLLMESEKQAALISQKEVHNLLAASKTQVHSLQQQLDQLQTSNTNLEKDNSDLQREVGLLKSTATDLQQKVVLLERNGNTIVPSEKQMESFYKGMQQRHQIQLRDMQSQLETVMNKLEAKENECVTLEEKLRSATRAYDALQVTKAETVNKLATQLEESQRKMQKLATKAGLQETTKLQILLEQAQNEKKALEEKLSVTSQKLESIEKDLQQYESASRLGLFNNEDSSFETDSITHMGISRRHSLGGKSDKLADNSRDSCKSKRSSADQEDLNSKLRTELHRALQGQHSKRTEIRRLQEQLAAKEKRIKCMLEQEQIYVTESKKYEANLAGVLERLKRQQEDLKTATSNESLLKRKCEDLEKAVKEANEKVERLGVLEKENASLKQKVLEMEIEEKEKAVVLENYNSIVNRAREEIPSAVEKELVDLKVRLDQSQKECAEIKQLYIQISADKRELLSRFEEKDSQIMNLEIVKTERDEYQALYQESLQIIKDLKAEQDRLQKSLSEAARSRVLEKETENKRANDIVETECVRLQEELTAAADRHHNELERIRKELSYSRERLLQLECKLREEFQTKSDSMTTEIESLRKQISQKDELLEEYAQALSRIKPASKDAAVETTSDEGFREKASALAVQLEKAEERHRNIIETLRQEFDRRLAMQENEMRTAHERQLVLIAARYKTEIATIEDQVKEEAAKYFAEEVSALQEKNIQEHNAIVKRMRENEAMFANHIENLKKSLQERTKKVEELQRELESGNDEDIKQLHQQIESERDKMAEMLKCWAGEVQELRNEKNSLAEELEAVRAKYKTAKKVAFHYRKEVAQARQNLKDEWQRKSADSREALSRVKERVDEVRKNDERDRRDTNEKLYEKELLDMAAKQRGEMKFNPLS